MKRLEKLTLKELKNSGMGLNSCEANRTKGGDWQWSDGEWRYLLDEVTVTAPRIYNIQVPSSVYSDYNGFTSAGGFWANYQMGSDMGIDQIWLVFRGWAGSDIAIFSPEVEGGGGGETSEITTMSANGIDFMKSWEKGPNGGAALMPYDDNGDLPGGYMTIGWGHLIKAGEDFSTGITIAQAESIFLADIQWAINDVINSVNVPLTQSQFDALVSYSFNIGGLNNSPACLEKLNNGDYGGAAEEMDIITSGGVVLPGLVTRRADEQNMFNNGIYNNHN